MKSRRDGALERQKNLERIGQETVLNEMIAAELNRLLSFIDSLQQEQPSLPSDLDEAAWAYVKKKYGIGEPEKVFENEEIAEDFKAGAEWMAQQGWISVDEKLPEMEEEVIVLTDELGTAPIYKIAFGHIVDVERCIDYNGWNIPGVKYWMPCPEIPNND